MWKTLKIFYGFLLQKKAVFVLFIITLSLSGIVSSVLPFFYKQFVDEIQNGRYSLIQDTFIKYIVFLFGSLFLGVLSWHIGDFIIIDAAAEARTKVFRYIQDLDFAFHVTKSTGSLISAIKRGDGAFFAFYFGIHQKIIEVTIGFVVMIFALSQLAWYIGLFAFLSIVVSLFICYFVIRFNLSARNKLNDDEDEVSAVIVDNLIGFETVKLFAREDYERKRLDISFAKWKKSLWGYQNSFRYYDLSIGLPLNLMVAGLIFIMLKTSQLGKFSVGEFVLVVGFVNLLYSKVWDLIWTFRDIAKNYADIQKYFAILNNEIQVKDPQLSKKLPVMAGDIKFEDVGFSYSKNRNKSVKDFDLHVKAGESVALVGRSGAGKTTIVKLLMRFYDVNNGKISLDDIDIRDMTKSQLRSLMGIVPQEPVLFNNTIGYNIAYGADNVTVAQIKAAAKMANIDSFIESLPKKYQTDVGERGIKLSGGQKQRVAIARMILKNPKIVIFDEATSHLDSESERLIQDAFWKASKNKTTIIIAHRLSTVMRADKIIVMEKGKVIEAGSHGELVAQNSSFYKYLWDLQVSV